MTARVGVVGRVEWVQFVEVPAFPRRGAIAHAHAHAHGDFEQAAGGGMVAAVHLVRL